MARAVARVLIGALKKICYKVLENSEQIFLHARMENSKQIFCPGLFMVGLVELGKLGGNV